MSDRLVRCRYLRRNGEQCTGPALEPDGDVLLCAKHLSRALPALEAVRRVAFGPDWMAKVAEQEAEQKARAELAKTAGLVYYAQVWGNIKIGTTIDIENRMKELKATRVLATEPGSYALEVERHRQFASARIRGEYFRPTPELLAHTEALCAEHGPPITTTGEQMAVAAQRGARLPGEASHPAGLGAARLVDALRPRRQALRPH